MKNKNNPGLFDKQERMEKLNNLRDPLISIGATINFEGFRNMLEKATIQESHKPGGRPAFDRVMLFKALVLQKLYGLSDEQLEYQINDRLSFMRFLGLELSDKVPDQKTFWMFRDVLTKTGVIDQVFVEFRDRLRQKGYIVNEGKIVDASLVSAPIQRNSRDENGQIKQGEIPEDWSENKRNQKDLDASWTVKHGKHYYGYKNHIKADNKSKLIDEFEVTPANISDNQILEELLDETDCGQPIWADTAYYSEGIKKILKRKKIGCRINKRGARYVSLSPKQREANRIKSRIRVRVEHIFASMRNRVNGLRVRCIGLSRSTADITLQNLAYNMTRVIYLKRNEGISIPI
jgi:transposase, IS5 family